MNNQTDNSVRAECVVTLQPNTLQLIDCMDFMRECPSNYFDLAIVDPPYGIGDYNNKPILDKRSGKKWISTSEKYKKINWNDTIPSKEYFEELKRVAKNHIIFGFQFYTQYLWSELKGVIIHDFVDHSFNMSHADVAITNLQKRTTVYEYLWSGFKKEYKNPMDKNRIHPAEKPNSLYKWLLKNYAKTGYKILDTHVGSGSSLVACKELGFEYYGCEIDEEYFAKANERIARAYRKYELFE